MAFLAPALKARAHSRCFVNIGIPLWCAVILDKVCARLCFVFCCYRTAGRLRGGFSLRKNPLLPCRRVWRLLLASGVHQAGWSRVVLRKGWSGGGGVCIPPKPHTSRWLPIRHLPALDTAGTWWEAHCSARPRLPGRAHSLMGTGFCASDRGARAFSTQNELSHCVPGAHLGLGGT